MKYLFLLLILTGCRSTELPTNEMQQTDSCGNVGSVYLQSNRLSIPNEGLTPRQQYKLSKSLIKHEYQYIKDSVRISYKTVYDTMRLAERTIRVVQKQQSTQAIKERRIDESWKKWLIVGGLVWLFVSVFLMMILKKYKIL